jgi:ferritin-like metal-binding protein YciE
MKKLASLEDAFMTELRDMYNAESQLVKALPRMAKAASAPELQSAITEHLEQTRGQIERLEQVFDTLGARVRGKKCLAMEGLVEEGKELISEDAEPGVMDASIIAAAQKVEHYEIASYGTLCAWAKQLGHDDAAQLLSQNLEEEKMADQKLSQIAESFINWEAITSPEGDVSSDGRASR